MSNRESARLARRRAVDEAARKWQRAEGACIAYMDSPRFDGRGYGLQGLVEEAEGALLTLREALALPRPWVTGGQRVQPRRHTRPQRRRRGRCAWGCWCRRSARNLYDAVPLWAWAEPTIFPTSAEWSASPPRTDHPERDPEPVPRVPEPLRSPIDRVLLPVVVLRFHVDQRLP